MRSLSCLLGLTFVLCSCVSAIPDDTTRKAERVNVSVFRGNVYDALSSGGEVYLCSLVRHSQLSDQCDGIIERGRAELKVVKTICGPAREKLVLPYSFAVKGFVKSDYFQIWPSLDAFGGQYLLCVVVPSAYDPCVGKLPDVDGAASEVYVVPNEKDPLISEMTDICELHKIEDAKELNTALKKALLDSRPAVRRYAVHAAAKKLACTDVPEAITLIESIFKPSDQHPKMEADELLDAVDVLASMWHRADTKPETDKMTFRSLSRLVASESQPIRERAAIRLSACASQASFAPDEIFDKNEWASLEKSLKALESCEQNNVGESARGLLDWLQGNGGSPPNQPPDNGKNK